MAVTESPREGNGGELLLMGIEFQFCKIKKERSGDGLHSKVNTLTTAGLYTLKSG